MAANNSSVMSSEDVYCSLIRLPLLTTCVATNLPLIVALSKTRVLPDRLLRLLFIMSISIILQALISLLHSVVYLVQGTSIKLILSLSMKMSFIIAFATLGIAIDRYMTFKGVLSKRNSGQSQVLVLLPLIGVIMQICIDAIAFAFIAGQPLLTAFLNALATPTVISGVLCFSVEILTAVIYFLVIRKNKRELSKFSKAGRHQTLNERVSLKQTAQISSALFRSVLVQVSLYMISLVFILAYVGLLRGEGTLAHVLIAVGINLLYVHSILHPILVVHGSPLMRSHVQKQGIFKFLNCIKISQIAINHIGPVLDSGDRYIKDLEHVWSTKYKQHMQELASRPQLPTLKIPTASKKASKPAAPLPKPSELPKLVNSPKPLENPKAVKCAKPVRFMKSVKSPNPVESINSVECPETVESMNDPFETVVIL